MVGVMAARPPRTRCAASAEQPSTCPMTAALPTAAKILPAPAPAVIVQMVEWRGPADRADDVVRALEATLRRFHRRAQGALEAQAKAPSQRPSRSHRGGRSAARSGRDRPRSRGSIDRWRRPLDDGAPYRSGPREYTLFKDEVTVGRGEDNDVVIPHASVSRAHARLMKRNGAYELMDLNSTNGTFVDDPQGCGLAGAAERQSGALRRRAVHPEVLRFCRTGVIRHPKDANETPNSNRLSSAM